MHHRTRTSSVAALAVVLILSSILSASPAYTQSGDVPSFVMVTWNIQSGRSAPSTIADQMALFDGVDIWTLQEVNSREVGYYQAGAEDGESASFGTILSSAGDGNHLLTLYDESAFALVESVELAQINTTGNARPALVLQLRDIATSEEFLVINNHLYSSKPAERLRQAALLGAWAREQTLPVIAGGDMNFEAVLNDPAYAAITSGGHWERIIPDNDGPTRPNGRAIDHIFVVGAARQWPVSAHVVERENDLDNEQNSDHRPVIALVGPDVAAPLVPCATTAQECLFDEASATPTVPAPTSNAAQTAVVSVATANLRGGPGTGFEILGRANQGTGLSIAGVSADGQWYQLVGGGWIAASLVVVGAPTPLPTPTVVGRLAATLAITPEVATPTATPVPAATPTATPVPTPVATAPGALTIVFVDKRAEYVVIRNNGGSLVDLGGWTLLSEKGDQCCALGGVIEPGVSLTISALGDVPGFNCGFGSNIWNNSERDPAALIAPDGSVVSRYE